MKNNLCIDKAALGIRYLIKYIENGRIENFKVVKNCLNEVKLWILITFFTNNMDSLAQDVPDYLLEDIFLMRPLVVGKTKNEVDNLEYGDGFSSVSNLTFKEQFKLIRDCLSHSMFSFSKNLIYVNNGKGYKAVFDILWLEKLTTVILANNRFDLKKGMSDISIMSLVPEGDYSTEQFINFCNKGLIQLYKVTSLTSNKETILNAIKIDYIELDRCNFELIFQTALYLMQKNKIDINLSINEALKEIKSYFKSIETFFGNYIKLDLIPLNITNDILNNSDFQKLSYIYKLRYLINSAKFQDPVRYNSVIVYYLLNLLEKINNDNIQEQDLFILNDAYNFLLKVYANIYFSGLNNNFPISMDYLNSLNVNCRFVHAKNIYKEYLKVLNRSLKDLNTYGGPVGSKNHVLNEIKNYLKYLDEANMDLAYKDFNWKMRNSVVHDQVQFIDDSIRFYTTGRNIKVKVYSKKNNEWVYKDFANNKPIWEMIIDKKVFLAFLDDLFLKNNFEINVNISKYCKRSSYLK